MSALDDEIRPGSRTAGGLVGLDNGRYGGAAGARADAAVRSAWAGAPFPGRWRAGLRRAVAVAIQSALNGRVGAAAGSPWPATLVNFAVAALTLAVTLLVELTVRGSRAGS
ncbi:DMT family transporter [Pseudonocardia sp. Cha107L01]|uniref:DMT family transporter n=1 Tax=Pseudonocardia sp. Cha107L01 TaxID=3457576 RepID=UPI00403EE129